MGQMGASCRAGPLTHSPLKKCSTANTRTGGSVTGGLCMRLKRLAAIQIIAMRVGLGCVVLCDGCRCSCVAQSPITCLEGFM